MFKFVSADYLFVRKMLKTYTCNHLVLMFQLRFYDLKKDEIGKLISEITNDLDQYNFNSKMEDYTEKSMIILKSYLFDKYNDKKRDLYDLDKIKINSEKIIQDYPVILSTTYSLKGSLSNNIIYDYVIIDEASQVNVCTGALALSCAKNAVIVGDLKQLSHVVDSKIELITNAIFTSSQIPDFYHYKKYSLLSSIITIYDKVPRTLLREHYRCHPKIIEFCNKKFYGGELIILTEDKGECDPLVVYKTVEGNHERNRLNQRQIDVIKNEVVHEQSLNLMNDSVGIISPYRKQTNALEVAFKESRVEANTVDKFQGQEKEIIILSTVDNEITEFVDNRNRLNVAISRAVKKLIVVVGDNVTESDTNISDLVKYVEYNNLSVIPSKINSIFDLLYSSYAERRKEFLSKYKQVSKFDSENVMYALIVKILSEKGAHNLEIAQNVSLNTIFTDTILMTKREEQFVLNELSHVDFLIYDSLTKDLKFGIEVDSLKYHGEGTVQVIRDKLKNEIFKKYGLLLLRFRTDGSNESAILSNTIDEILNN